MSTDAKNDQTHCKIAQLHESVYRIRWDREDDGSFERLVRQLDDVNIKGISDKPKNGRLSASKYKGCTPLHVACYRNHIKVFGSLLKRGADFTAKNADGNTAIHHAFYRIFAKNLGTTYRIIGRLKDPLINSVLMAHVETMNYENPCSEEELSHFHIACAANHVKAVQLFLDNGVCVDKSVNADSSLFPGYTPLHFAARFCGYETAKLLLQRGEDLTLKNAKGMHPLHMIIRRKWRIFEWKSDPIFSIDTIKKLFVINEKIMKMFLESSPAVDIGIKELAKLLCAYTTSDSSLTESFLRDVDVKCAVSMDCSVWPGFTALHLAAHLDSGVDQLLSTKLLLENGADILAKDAKGVTPFDIYMQKYSLENLSDILSSVPAFKDVFFSDNKTRLLDFISAMQSKSTFNDFFRTSRKDIFLPENCHPWPGYWLPHLAVAFCIPRGISKDSHYMIEACLSFEDVAVVRDAHGRTPIHLAFCERKIIITNMFFQHQSKITDIIDKHGLSYLHIACSGENGHMIVKMLLPTVGDVNGIYKDETLAPSLINGSGPLHFAVAAGNVETIKMLLRRGADVHATDVNGRTPIHRVLISRYSRVSQQKKIGDLLFSSCDLKNIVVSGSGLSYLHVASSIGNEDAIKDLLKLGANPNVEYNFEIFTGYRGITSYDPPRFSKRTPLHYAVINNHAKVVELLMQGGADVLYKKSDGMALFYEAFKQGIDPLPSEFGGMPIGRYFASMLANDVTLQKRVKEDTGITLLHIACVLHDVDQIKSLLIDSGANPNSQIHSNAPIWPKATPLHLLISCGRNSATLEDAMKLLLDCGADVTLMDENEDTHWIHTFTSYEYAPKPHYANYLRLLLRSQRDFSLNPINALGISHFHVACMAQEYAIAEKFVVNGADVNFPIYFCSGRLTFQTPLHIVLKYRFLHDQPNNETLLRTIDVLLKYGANVNVQDECCSTPLLEAARMGPERELVFDKLIKAGADSNYTNMRGESVFEILFKSRELVTCEKCSFVIGNRVNFQLLNPISNKGTISIKHPTNYKNFIKTISEAPNLPVIDRMGRTPIHSIVANSNGMDFRTESISFDEYADKIEQILKLGYEIDAQDFEGKTALHMAAYWQNKIALLALLDAGADVNVTDVNNEPAITRNVRARYRYEIRNRTTQQDRSPTERTFALHIITLQLCGLEVCSENLELANNLPRDQPFLSHCEQVSKEIEMAKQITIGTGSLTLNDFFSETGIVAARPSMASEVDREAVDKLLENIDIKRFRHTRGLIKMQHKKTMTRLSLIKAATESAWQLIGIINGFSMPEICLRMIVRCLTNTEVKKLIESTSANVANEQ